jgi:hypothetical protein
MKDFSPKAGTKGLNPLGGYRDAKRAGENRKHVAFAAAARSHKKKKVKSSSQEATNTEGCESETLVGSGMRTRRAFALQPSQGIRTAKDYSKCLTPPSSPDRSVALELGSGS